MRRMCAAVLLVLTGACGRQKTPPAPNQNVRSDMYSLMIQSARFSNPGLSLQLLSDSVTTVLDSVVLTGVDASYTAWKKLVTDGEVNAADRTVISTRTIGDSLILDHGRIVFSRKGMKDTTMEFASTWRREKAGWRLFLDSVRAQR